VKTRFLKLISLAGTLADVALQQASAGNTELAERAEDQAIATFCTAYELQAPIRSAPPMGVLQSKPSSDQGARA
jgi:hypothetical protein